VRFSCRKRGGKGCDRRNQVLDKLFKEDGPGVHYTIRRVIWCGGRKGEGEEGKIERKCGDLSAGLTLGVLDTTRGREKKRTSGK